VQRAVGVIGRAVVVINEKPAGLGGGERDRERVVRAARKKKKKKKKKILWSPLEFEPLT
jgi:hypothetical protein